MRQDNQLALEVVELADVGAAVEILAGGDVAEVVLLAAQRLPDVAPDAAEGGGDIVFLAQRGPANGVLLVRLPAADQHGVEPQRP